MKYLLEILVLFTLIGFIFSCTTPKLISKAQLGKIKIKFFYSSNPDPSKAYKSFYAKVDSSSFQTYYIFQTQNIYKESKPSDGLINTLVYDTKPTLSLSVLDRFVFNKADSLMDFLGRKDLKRAKGANGFVTEVNNERLGQTKR